MLLKKEKERVREKKFVDLKWTVEAKKQKKEKKKKKKLKKKKQTVRTISYCTIRATDVDLNFHFW